MTNKEEESVSASSIDHTSSVSIATPTQQQPWNKGMNILLGCKVSGNLSYSVGGGDMSCYVTAAHPRTAIQQDNTTTYERQEGAT